MESHKDEIIKLCEMFNARAYIKMNYCDASKIALHMIKEVSDYILSDNLRGIKSCYDSCCGKYSGPDKSRKYWIIDLDGDEVQCAQEVINIINNNYKEFPFQFLLQVHKLFGHHFRCCNTLKLYNV